jgi:DNA repair protein RadC
MEVAMASQSVARGSESPQIHTYSLKEFQLVVRDAPAVPAEIAPFVGRSYHGSADVYAAFRHLATLPTEAFLVVHLNAKNVMVGMTTVSVGCLTRSLVHPREVFRPAIANLTASLLLIHNHPSGVPDPSAEDIAITRRLVEVGKLVGIRVLDHVIVGDGRYYSFADEGVL